jgi:ABC-2 type transport system permease protein
VRKFFVIYKREFNSLFLSPVAYVTAMIFTAAASWTFIEAVQQNTGEDESLVMLLIVSVMVWMPILITVVCMRLFAEEKRSGTLETLMTAAVSERSVVLGKYFSSLVFVWLMMAPAMASIYVLVYLSPGIADVDLYGFLGVVLLLGLVSAACVSIGLLVSLLTRNQIIAAICCFAAICIPFFDKSVAVVVPFVSDNVIEYISVENHLLAFSSGSLSLQVVVLYLSLAVLMLFSSVRVLESRRWK